MSPKKGGLSQNPLFSRTDKEPEGIEELTFPEDNMTSRQADTPASGGVTTSANLVKFTFFFSDPQLARLDEVYESLRPRGRGRKNKISKSQIVRLALNRWLDDFDENPEEMIRQLEQQQPDK